MGSSSVVPAEIVRQFGLKCIEPHRYHDSSRALVLDGPDEALNQRNRPMLSDRTKPRLDAARVTPISILLAKLRPLVADNVLRCASSELNGSVKQIRHVTRSRLLLVDAVHQGFAGVMVDDHGHPEAEGPALHESKRKPRYPESQARGYHREIDVPDVMRIFGGDRAIGLVPAGTFRPSCGSAIVVLGWSPWSFEYGCGSMIAGAEFDRASGIDLGSRAEK
jgi:hypothetical protein